MAYTVKIHNVQTDEIIERDMTPEEIEIFDYQLQTIKPQPEGE